MELIKEKEITVLKFRGHIIILACVLITSVIIVLLTSPKEFVSLDSIRSAGHHFVISFLFTLFLTYGNWYLVGVLNARIPWVKKPKKRFLWGIVTVFVYSLSISVIIFYLYSKYVIRVDASVLTIGYIWDQTREAVLISFVIVFLFASNTFLYNWKNAILLNERLEKEKIANKYESLRKQVSPHFLFNSLNALSSLVYEDQDLAVKYIKQLADVYRYVLDAKEKDIVTVGEELEFLSAYIFLQKIRYGENLNIEIQITTGNKTHILPMALQLLLENAIKHNVVSMQDPLFISIRSEADTIVFENTLKPRKSQERPSGTGLKNLRERYRFFTDRQVEILPSEDKFTVKIPILKMDL